MRPSVFGELRPSAMGPRQERGPLLHERPPPLGQVRPWVRGLDAVRLPVRQGQLSVADDGRGSRMLGAARPPIWCVSVPAQAESCPQDAIRAGGRAGGQRSGSIPGNARESTGYACDGGGPPFTLSPEIAGSERSSLPFVFRALGSTPPRVKRGDRLERRSPTGIARERETRPNDAAPDRAGARNLHRRRCAPPMARLQTHASPPAQNRAHAWSAGLRPASRGSAKPAPTTLAPPISGCKPTHRHPRKITGTWSAGL